MSDLGEVRGGDRRLGRREALRITAVAGLSVGIGGGLLRELIRRARLHRVSETRTRMGTVVTITVVHPDAERARGMVSAAFAEMERLEAILSRHRPGTPVHRLNSVGRLRDAPVELIEVVGAAERYSESSGGAFDITVTPLLDLFERSFAVERGPPTASRVREVLRLVDYRAVRVAGRTVELAPGMSITLDGIGKGYVVDRATDVLVAAGAQRVLVDAGGDMATAGAGSRDDPWMVGVQDPDDESRFVELVHLAGECIATSGDYMRTFSLDRRFHHIVDPRGGYSPDHTRSASVVAATAMDADALSTTVLVLGPREGIGLLESLPEIEGLVVTKDGEQVRTSGMGRHTVPAW